MGDLYNKVFHVMEKTPKGLLQTEVYKFGKGLHKATSKSSFLF